MSPLGEVMMMPILPLFCVDDPSVWIIQSFSWLSSCLGEVNYGCSGSILYVELTKLEGPLYHSSNLMFIHYFLNGLVRHYYDRVSLKVWMKLSGGHYQGEGDLLYSRVSGFSSLEGWLM